MMTWCFARNYLQPNTHCSGSPPSLHTWSIQAHIPVSVSAFIMTPPGWLGGDCGIKMHIPASPRPWHHPIQAPLAPGAADPLTFTGVWVNIWAPCVCDTLGNTNIEKRAVFAGVNSLSYLDQILPLDHVTDSDFISKHVKCSNTFLILGIYFQKSPSLLLTCPKPRTKDGCLTLDYPPSPDHSMFIQA